MAYIFRRTPAGELEIVDVVLDANIAAILAKTHNLPAHPANEDTAYAAVLAAQAAVVEAQKAVAKVDLFNSAEIFVFPEVTNVTCTLTAGLVANTFGAWAEIVDSGAVTLSSKFATKPGYLGDVTLYTFSAADKMWLIELSYGAAKSILGRVMVRSDWTYVMPIKSRKIPAGETVYYRLMCETGGATCKAAFRYFYE